MYYYVKGLSSGHVLPAVHLKPQNIIIGQILGFHGYTFHIQIYMISVNCSRLNYFSFDVSLHSKIKQKIAKLPALVRLLLWL